MKEAIKCACVFLFLAACWGVCGLLEWCYHQHPAAVTIGLFAALIGVVIHEWRTIEW